MADGNTGLIPIKASVNMDDVVSVRVSEIETRLEGLITEQRQRVKDAKAKLTERQSDRTKVNEAAGKADFTKRFNKVNAALGTAGIKVRVIPGGGGTLNSEKKEFSYAVSFNLKDEYSRLHDQVTIPAPKAVIDADEDVVHAQEDLNVTNEKYLQLMEAKGKINTVERAARAQVAEMRLEQTDEGKEILERLRSSDVNRLLALPAKTV